MNIGNDSEETSSKISLIAAIVLSFAAFGGFLYYSGLMESALLMIILSMVLISPFRKNSEFVKRFLLILSIMLVIRLFEMLGTSIIPFFFAFLMAYILDPLVTKLHRRNVPRWLSSLLIILLMIGAVTTVAIFVFPLLFEQLDAILRSLSDYVASAKQYVESDAFYERVESMGLPRENIQTVIQEQLLPKIENIISAIFSSFLTILNSLSAVLTQLINAILIPIIAFYMLKDFSTIKQYIAELLAIKNMRLLSDLKRINRILKKYIGWQVLAATIVATFSSISYIIFGVPYPFVLGILAGLLNPLPYLGTVLSCIIGIVTVILVNDGNIWQQIFVILITINGIHFVNAYFLEPNIVGRQVGLHPVLLLISLFIFGGLFGLVGLLIAIPTTAALMMFFEDWRINLIKANDHRSSIDNIGK